MSNLALEALKKSRSSMDPITYCLLYRELTKQESNEIQSVLFDPEMFTPDQAREWLRTNELTPGKLDETEGELRFRQKSPAGFEDDSFRTIELADGVKAVIARPKKEYDMEDNDKEAGCACKALFVAYEPSAIDLARQERMTGPAGECFKRKYLKPLGLKRSEVRVTTVADWKESGVLDTDGAPVIALGRQAFEELAKKMHPTTVGNLLFAPHPTAILRKKSEDQLNRKLRQIKKTIDQWDYTRENPTSDHSDARLGAPVFKGKPEAVRGDKVVKVAITKAESDQIVYGVVLDPYLVDAHDDWIPPRVVQDTAHAFLQNSRIIGLQHEGAADAELVESSVVHYPSTEDYRKAREGEPHRVYRMPYGAGTVHSGTWIIGTKVHDPEVWQAILNGDITGFSIGGFGIREGSDTADMPEVEVIDLN